MPRGPLLIVAIGLLLIVSARGRRRRAARRVLQLGWLRRQRPRTEANGKASYSTWYELVPNPPVPIRLHVKPGDSVAAPSQLEIGGLQGAGAVLQLVERDRTDQLLAADDQSSLHMALLAACALLCHIVGLYLLPPAWDHRREG
jgi:hypothetical protein